MRPPWDRESRVRAGARRPAPLVSHPSLGSRGSEAPGPLGSLTAPLPPGGLRQSPARSRSSAGGYDAAAEEYAACPRVTWPPPSYILGKQDGEEWAFCGQGGGKDSCYSLLHPRSICGFPSDRTGWAVGHSLCNLALSDKSGSEHLTGTAVTILDVHGASGTTIRPCAHMVVQEAMSG
ncbi:uncharacterized protein LOC118350379 isoform X3 [Canis lupus dingo]|uniref:uncharacterized protein LOC118350379 isoform X3 n=1 Tax=Canis lupus dingo TaxID=286419 RepID=UPI0020C4DD48|nr:uncharacterized protein LOC118350379 isoform X3 [Canis lupus dingo]